VTWIDTIIKQIGRAVSWLNIVLIILICIDVMLRYIFNYSKNWMVELEWHFFAIIFLLGSSYALQSDSHVRVDVFYQQFSEKTKSLINLLGTLLFLLPWCYVIIKTATQITLNSWYIKEGSAQPGGLPARYVIKSMIIIGFVLLALQGLSMIIHYFRSTNNKSWKDL